MEDSSEAVRLILTDLQTDTRSDTTEVTAKAVKCLETFSHVTSTKASLYSEMLITLGRALIETHPTMASIFNLVNGILLSTEAARRDGSLSAIQEELRKALQEYLKTRRFALEAIASYGQGLLGSPSTVLTHSSSATVAGVMREAVGNGKSIQAIAMESRPHCEGREMARTLGQHGILTRVVLDAAMAHYVEQADIILVGADRIADTSFLNKVGTLALATMAHAHQIPFYIACETSKLLPVSVAPIHHVFEEAEQHAHEEWMNVELVYSLFEEIPNRWITGVITEQGIQSVHALTKYFKDFEVATELQAESPLVA
jgi:translation initiation factor 2B subunit (eIF-2B alpha/beta/delta family)